MAESEYGSRQKLVPWLKGQINGGRIPGLCWLNDEKTKFKIPWKNGRKQDWNESDGLIFKEWAKQTGRYTEGTSDPDYSTWKARLRNALHKAKHIVYVEEESRVQDDNPEAYRVYMFKPRSDGEREDGGSTSCCLTDGQVSDQTTTYCPGQNREAPLPAMVDALNEEISSQLGLPDDLTGINSSELNQFHMETPGHVTMGSGDGSLSSVIMVSVDEKSDSMKWKTYVDEQQLVDSLNSITFDSVAPTHTATESTLPTSTMPIQPGAVVGDLSDAHPNNPQPCNGLVNIGSNSEPCDGMASQYLAQPCGCVDAGTVLLVQFDHPRGDELARASSTLSAVDGGVYGHCATPHSATSALPEQYGCIDLQDMITSDPSF